MADSDTATREGLTFAQRHNVALDTLLWCVDCGEEALAGQLTWWQECAVCAQWWRDNPPPSEEATS